MRVEALRRVLRASPRAILIVLLAFAIEIVPAPSFSVQHRHTHGDAPHVHAGRIIDGVRPDAEASADAGSAPGFHAAVPFGRHRHLTPPAVVGAMPSIATVAPPRLVVPLAPLVIGDESPETLHPGRARSPPSHRA